MLCCGCCDKLFVADSEDVGSEVVVVGVEGMDAFPW